MAWRQSRHAPSHAAAVALAAVVALLVFKPEARFYPPCPIYRYLHVRCPGCGATRALTALLHGRWGEAWAWNGLFVASLPLLLGYLALAYWRADWPEVPRATILGALGIAMAFVLARNLIGM